MEVASFARLNMSEYLRRRFFGRKPIIAHTDVITIWELRSIGGLLKYGFETLRQANVSASCIDK